MTAPSRVRLGLGLLVFTLSTSAPAQTVASLDAGSADHDDGYVYRLPYRDGESYTVIQGYGSPLSHRGSEYYTIDFGMPPGTLVLSAREGRVERTEDRYDRSCWSARCARYANFVDIRHADGTLGRYFHLQKGSVLVQPGQWVERGEPIALSGDTGYSNAPHLHFGVYETLSEGVEQSIAVRFAVRGGYVGRLRAGARYLSPED